MACIKFLLDIHDIFFQRDRLILSFPLGLNNAICKSQASQTRTKMLNRTQGAVCNSTAK